MKTVITHILTYALWIQSLMIPLSVAHAFDPYENLSFTPLPTQGQGGSADNDREPPVNVDLDPAIDLDGEGTDSRYEGMTEEEIALQLAAEQLAQNRADCDDGKGGIEVGVVTVKKIVEGEDGSQSEREEKVDCNQIAYLQFKLLEADIGSDKAFQCTTKNWYVDEQVKFAKELELPLAEKFCKDKIKQSPKEKTGECVGGLVCNMLKTPLGDAVGFDPLPAIVEFAAGDTSFGKGCKDTPGTGCLSNVIWGLFKNLFVNVEGFWDLGKLLAKGVIAGGKWVVEKVGEVADWVGDKISDGWAALSNWWNGTEPIEDVTSAKQDVISQQEDGFFKDFLSNPVQTTGNLVSSFMTGIFDMIKEGTQDNFMCGGDYYKYEGNFTDANYGSQKTKQNMAQRGWEEITNFGSENEPERHDKIRCDQPFIAECASCAQWMNMACGLTGFLGGEVITAVLTGGAVNLVGKAAKGTAAAGKSISAALKQTSAWQKVASKGDKAGKGMLKGLDALKGAYKGGTEFLAGIPGAKLATGIVKQGGKLALLLGKKTLDIGRFGKDKLLAALNKGKALAKATRADKLAGKVLKWPKRYLETLNDAFILGMQGKSGFKIARMARESSRIRNELKGLQAAANGGDESAKALVAAHQKRLNLLDEHQRLTREAMKATDDATRTRLLDDAKRQADQLDESRAAIAKAKVDHDNAIRLKAQKEAEQARLAKAADETSNRGVANQAIKQNDNVVNSAQRQGATTSVNAGDTSTITLAGDSEKLASSVVTREVVENSKLDDISRITKAQKELGVTTQQAEAILDAHKKVPCAVGKCTPTELGEKIRIMKESGMTKSQYREALRKGYAGNPPSGNGLAIGDDVLFKSNSGNEYRGRYVGEDDVFIYTKDPSGKDQLLRKERLDLEQFQNFGGGNRPGIKTPSEGDQVVFVSKRGNEYSGTFVREDDVFIYTKDATGKEQLLRKNRLDFDQTRNLGNGQASQKITMSEGDQIVFKSKSGNEYPGTYLDEDDTFIYIKDSSGKDQILRKNRLDLEQAQNFGKDRSTQAAQAFDQKVTLTRETKISDNAFFSVKSKSGNTYKGKFAGEDSQFVYFTDSSGRLNKLVKERLDLPTIREVDTPNVFGNVPNQVSRSSLRGRERVQILTDSRRAGQIDVDAARGFLKELNLPPAKSFMSDEGARVTLSQPFKDADGRVFVVAEIEKNGKTTFQTMYRSNSQSVYRVLPARNKFRGRVPGYDKGPGEEFLTVSSQFQKEITETVAKQQNFIVRDPADLEGILPVNRSMDDWLKYSSSSDAVQKSNGPQVELLKPSDKPLTDSVGRTFSKPEDLVIADQRMAPDYSNTINQYQIDSPVYGKVEANVYRSKNGQIEYTLLRDEKGRAWFGEVANIGQGNNANGLRVGNISEELSHPLWEYHLPAQGHSQIPAGYVGARHPTHGSYHDMWDYIKDIPDIKRWYLEKGIPIP